jgi:hypothetical protein
MGPLQQVIDSYTDSRVTEAHHLQEICRYLASKPCKKHQKSAKTMFFLNEFNLEKKGKDVE